MLTPSACPNSWPGRGLVLSIPHGPECDSDLALVMRVAVSHAGVCFQPTPELLEGRVPFCIPSAMQGPQHGRAAWQVLVK